MFLKKLTAVNNRKKQKHFINKWLASQGVANWAEGAVG
jgi:hypothetical protein